MGIAKQLTFGSLFAGIGGFDLGFERAGMKCAWQVEIDDYANRVLEKHWPNVRRWRDVRTFPPEPADEWKVDVICGGFPCQDISYAGNGAGLDGERSGLFFEAIRVVDTLRPRAVVLENVAAITTRGLDRVLGTLAEIGLDAEWHCIPAAAIGAPHERDRCFIFAWPQQQGSLEYATRGRRDGAATPDNVECRLATVDARQSMQQLRASDCGVGAWRGDEPSRVVRQPVLGRMGDGISRRVDRLRGLGNAVVPQVAEWIGRQIVRAALD